MRVSVRSLLPALALLATPLGAQTPPSEIAPVAAAPAAAAPSDPLEKPVCKSIVPAGSRLGGKRVCMTRREWELQRSQQRKAVDDHISRGAVNGG
jgi:hypothetical protein